MRSKSEIVAEIRSDLMYENDWMDYAEAHQIATNIWEEELLEGLSLETHNLDPYSR